MPLVTLKEILSLASEKQNAVGAFNLDNHDSAEGILAAAEKRNHPVILSIAEAHYKILDMPVYAPYILDRIKRSSAPVVLNLDHGRTFEGMIRAVNYGFTSIMFDGSQLPYEENASRTKEIVKIAHAAGISVEAELGHVAFSANKDRSVGSKADRSAFTKPEEAVRFVEETGIDALAVAVGTVHGVYQGEPDLDFELLSTLHQMIPIPLVLHGGSGLSQEDFRKAISLGIRKINFNTGLVRAAVAAVKDRLTETNGNTTFAELTIAGRHAIERQADIQMEVFWPNP